LKKKLLKLSREKECGLLAEWMRSIINHLYWVAVSTPSAASDVMVDKWLSLSNHIHNRHKHEGTHFPQCLHPPLKKKWLKEGKATVKLQILCIKVQAKARKGSVVIVMQCEIQVHTKEAM
jgi:solute carrier family 8 (sodium/calcium exchanger)